VYLRLPVLVDDGVDRAALLRALVDAGIGATASYPASLAVVPDLRGYLATPTAAVPGARRVARSIVTLPTHPFVTAGDRDTMSMPFLRPLLRCAA
jgi:dTDP-4-amino-4,6-dideoxygalactose transaminase